MANSINFFNRRHNPILLFFRRKTARQRQMRSPSNTRLAQFLIRQPRREFQETTFDQCEIGGTSEGKTCGCEKLRSIGKARAHSKTRCVNSIHRFQNAIEALFPRFDIGFGEKPAAAVETPS